MAGEMLIQDLTGCRISKRLRIDRHFLQVLAQSLELVAHYHGSERDKDRAVLRHLDITDEPLSQLEKRIIYTFATDRNAA